MSTADPPFFVHEVFSFRRASCRVTGSPLPAPTPGDEFYVNIVLKTLGLLSVLEANLLTLRETHMGV